MASERKFIVENIRRILLKEHIRRATERAGFGGIDVQRTPVGTRITLIAERPGMVIGHKGSTIKDLTNDIETIFEFDNPKIEVQEDPNPSLNPIIMAEKLASALERGWHFRRAGHSTVRRIMESGARGCLVTISGKLTGERHRTEKFKAGHIKFCGEPKNQWMRVGYAVAKKKPGVMGIKVAIMDPNAILPSEIKVKPLPTEAQIAIQKALEDKAKEVALTAEGVTAAAIPAIPVEGETGIKGAKPELAAEGVAAEGDGVGEDGKIDPSKSKRARKKEVGEAKKVEAKKKEEERKRKKEEKKKLEEEAKAVETAKSAAAATVAPKVDDVQKEEKNPLPKPIGEGK